VRVAADEEDAQQLKWLGDTPPAEILVVSDLHLACGRDRVTGRFARTENFFADEEFAAFLDFYAGAGRRGALLVLNGDVFDFLRVTEYPDGREKLKAWSDALSRLGVERSPGQLEASIQCKERTFGLGTDDFKSLWKLRCIVEGHGEFLDGLAGWVKSGGTLLFVKGNHDLELHWPLIRHALRAELVQRGVTAQSADRRVLFCDAWVRIANVYIEHGHRFERATRVEGPPTLPQRSGQLNLPLGSFVNRYLLSPIERIEPFIDNVKPVKELLWTLVRQHPLSTLWILWRSWRFLLRAAQARQWHQGLAYALFFGSLAVPVATVLVIAVIVALPVKGAEIVGFFRGASWVLGLLGLFFPFLVGAVRGFFPKRRPPVGEDDMAFGVFRSIEERAAEPGAGTRYGVVGHTHVQDVQSLPPIGGAPVLYLNTGTWAPLWQADRPDLAGCILHPFVHFTRAESGVYEHEYREWDWDAARPAPSTILEPIAARRRHRHGGRGGHGARQ
jgi:UDP-2,3-diacylglucosamine pyrophosphatase LpxH